MGISFASGIDGDTVKIHGERIRQFRLAAQLSHPAGYVDLRETPIEAVRREWTEGIGVDSRLLRASRLCCAPSERIRADHHRLTRIKMRHRGSFSEVAGPQTPRRPR